MRKRLLFCVLLNSAFIISLFFLNPPAIFAQIIKSECVDTSVGDNPVSAIFPPGCQGGGERPNVTCTGADCAFKYIVDPHTITSRYGNRQGTLHRGIDLAGAVGTPIHALEAGAVIEIHKGCPSQGSLGSTCGGSAGNYIKIKDKNGRIHVYMHMSSGPNPNENDTVTSGQLLGPRGTSGQSTGPHLHYGIIAPNTSEYVNPETELSKWPNY